MLTDVDVIHRVNTVFKKKYGWQMLVGNFFSRLSGRYGKREFIEIKVEREK